MRLTLRNIQSHKLSVFDLTGSLVGFIGANHVGKSTLTRAFRWLFYDGMRGSRFIHKGETEAEVSLDTGSTLVSRIKGKNKNAYVVDGKSFDAIKTGAPVEVENALSVHKVRVDKDCVLELNVVRQSEEPFLVGGVTPAIRAKALNVLTGFHVLDAAIRETNTVIRRHTQEAEDVRKRMETLNGQLVSFTGLDSKVQSVTAAKNLLQATQDKIVKCTAMRGAVHAYESLAQLGESFKPIGVDSTQIIAILERVDNYLKAKDILDFRDKLAHDLDISQVVIGGVDLTLLDFVTSQMQWCVDAHRVVEEQSSLSSKVGEAVEYANRLEAAHIQADSAMKHLIGVDCPTCGQPMTEVCCH